jgi:uncharacterized protein
MRGQINQLVLKIAELCNLNCSYCYLYKHGDEGFRSRPKFMSDDVFEQILRRIREYCDRHKGQKMAIVFHGGEPTLLGRERLARFAERAREVLGACLDGIAMQTNGTLIDDSWLEMIGRFEIQVGVSVDGTAAVHDAHRVDFTGHGSHAAATRTLAMLQAAGMSPGILCVISPGFSGLEIYRHFRALGVQRMDFLLPDVTHDSRNFFYGDYPGTPVADYLIPIFDEWFAEDNPDTKIRIFWSLISAILGGYTESDQFGNPTCCYLVVETDGTIQANDVLRICGEGMAESGLNVFQHGFDDLALGLPLLYNVVHKQMPLSPKCRACRERDVCGGGYLPHRYSKANGFDNPSVWCPDLLRLINHIRGHVEAACAR